MGAIVILLADGWQDFELIDMHMGEKLERWGEVFTVRPDPQIIWPGDPTCMHWRNCHLRYHRSKSGGGSWEKIKPCPPSWHIHWKELTFRVQPTDFKHMGLFPEQAANWRWIIQKVRGSHNQPRVMNMFGYTGAATVAAAFAGAHVTHVDAAKGMNQWAKENAALSGVSETNLRFITEDALSFVQREVRRGKRYDALIMDPPSYGRGTSGEIWKIEDRLYTLVTNCVQLLSDNPLFFLINSYTTGFSSVAAANILKKLLQGTIDSGDVGIPAANGLTLPCGFYARWEPK
jgi:23S rRNA (cytosine1962-C5)-methyltransferase